MRLSGTSRTLWLWLRARGGHWTVQEVAARTGLDSQEVFRSLHAMSRRRLVEQVAPEPGQLRKRYGVTDDCLVPLGITVREASTGKKTGGAEQIKPAPKRSPARILPIALPSIDVAGLSPSELTYAHMSHRLAMRCAA